MLVSHISRIILFILAETEDSCNLTTWRCIRPEISILFKNSNFSIAVYCIGDIFVPDSKKKACIRNNCLRWIKNFCCRPFEIKKHDSCFCVTHTVKFRNIINFGFILIILCGNLIIQCNTCGRLIDIINQRNAFHIKFWGKWTPADVGQSWVNRNIIKIRSTGCIFRFQVTGQGICLFLIKTFNRKIFYKLKILLCVQLRSGNHPGIVINFSLIGIQCNLHGIFLVHAKIASYFDLRTQISIFFFCKILDLTVLHNLASIWSPYFISKSCYCIWIWIDFKSHLFGCIQRCNTATHKICLHLLLIAIHFIRLRASNFYHYFRKRGIIHIRTVIRRLTVHQKWRTCHNCHKNHQQYCSLA